MLPVNDKNTKRLIYLQITYRIELLTKSDLCEARECEKFFKNVVCFVFSRITHLLN